MEGNVCSLLDCIHVFRFILFFNRGWQVVCCTEICIFETKSLHFTKKKKNVTDGAERERRLHTRTLAHAHTLKMYSDTFTMLSFRPYHTSQPACLSPFFLYTQQGLTAAI